MKWIDSLDTLACLSNDEITEILDVIKRPGVLVSRRMPDSRAKNVTIYKEKHAIMDNIANHGHSGTDNSTKLYH